MLSVLALCLILREPVCTRMLTRVMYVYTLNLFFCVCLQSTAPLDPLVGTWTKHGTSAVHHHLLDACPTEDLFHGESKGT